MKRSNLFLTLTTGCLAVASFAFAKSHSKNLVSGWCTIGTSQHKCLVQTQIATMTVTPGSLNKARCSGHTGASTIAANNKTVHTVNGTTCKRTLYTKAE